MEQEPFDTDVDLHWEIYVWMKLKSVHLSSCGAMSHIPDLLGLWTSENEGAKFWLSVLTELKSRGVQDILIACVDGLKGFPEECPYEQRESTCQCCWK